MSKKLNQVILADFIGKRLAKSTLEGTEQQWTFPFCNGFYPSISTLKFDKDWNWLIPIYSKLVEANPNGIGSDFMTALDTNDPYTFARLLQEEIQK